MVLYVVLFIGFPFIMAFVYSFSNVTAGNPDFKIVGFGNFQEVLADPIFRTSLANTFIFTFVSIGLVLVLSNMLAELLMRQFRAKWLVRFLIMLPWTAPIALGAIGFLWFLDSVFSPLDWLLGPGGCSERPMRCSDRRATCTGWAGRGWPWPRSSSCTSGACSRSRP